MKLDEAKEILKYNGYILEDTETNDEEFEEMDDYINKNLEDLSYEKVGKLVDKRDEIRHRHNNVRQKIEDAALFNLENLFKEKGYKTSLLRSDSWSELQVWLKGTQGKGEIRIRVDTEQEAFDVEGYINDEEFDNMYYDYDAKSLVNDFDRYINVPARLW